MGASDYVTVSAPNFAAYTNPGFGLALGDRIADLPESYMKGREMSRARQMQDMFAGGLPEKNGSTDWSAAFQKYIKEGARIGGGQFMGGMMSPVLSEENARTAAALARGEQPPPSVLFGQSPVGSANSPVAGPGAAAAPPPSPQGQPQQGPTFAQVAASYRLPPASVDSLGRVLKIDPTARLSPQQVKVARLAIEEALPNRRTGDTGNAAPEETSTGATSSVEQNQNGPGGDNAAPLPGSGVSGAPGASAAGIAGQGSPPPFAGGGQASVGQPQTANQRVAGGFEQAGWRQTPVGTEAEAQRLIKGATNREAAAAYMEAKSRGSGKALLEQATADRKRASEIRASLGEYNKPTTEIQNAEASGIKGGPLAMEGFKTAQKEELARGDALQKGIQAKARDYDMQLKPHLDAMRGVLNDPNFVSGAGVGFQEALNRIRSSPLFKGLPGYDPNAALPNEAIRKVVATSVLDYTNELKAEAAEMGGTAGRIFQQQITLAEKASQNPDNSASALRFLTELQTRMGEHSKAVAELGNNYRGKYGRGVLDNGFNEALAKFNSETKNQIFKPSEIADMRTFAPPVAPVVHNKAEAMEWANKANVRPGDPIKIASTGRVIPFDPGKFK